MRGDWKRVSRRRPCPVCERPDWCLFVGDDDSPSAALCMRVESDRPARSGGGWLHLLRSDSPTWATWKRTYHVAARQAAAEPSRRPAPNIAKLAAEAEATVSPIVPRTMGEDPLTFCNDLGVSPESLRRLSVGYLKSWGAWTFPMRDARGEITGIRLRYPDGRKLSIRGGKEGLFIPSGLGAGGRLLIAEGPSDCAALLDLGFNAIGRPSCSGGVKHIVELVKRLGTAEVVVVADADGPGQRGAERLATALLPYVPSVRVITPPAKDAREWVRGGATAAEVNTLIEGTASRTLKIACRAVGVRSRGNRLRERTLPKA